MNAWYGAMNWPIDADWKCETCGYETTNIDGIGPIFGTLTWGLANGVCRCNRCYTQYTMRYDNDVHTTPRCLLKPRYKDAAKALWGKYQIPIDEFTASDWDGALSALLNKESES